MHSLLIHGAFDVLAWLAAGLAALWLTRVEKIAFPAVTTDLPYLAAILLGAGLGAYAFGTTNLWLSGMPGVARSIEGAVAGGIMAVELYKRASHIRTRTGARFALPFCVGVAVGRIGCYLAGLDDFTYGTPTTLPWGHDFGDGIARHPVQLYESAAMAAFAVFYTAAVRRRDPFVIENGFYLAAGFYAAQRFVWEFFKPYGALVGPLTLFHLLSIAVFAYACAMIATAPQGTPAHDRAVA
jgi:phosphatidylglycerol---prolipoprotein diacylglyceryl transferase